MVHRAEDFFSNSWLTVGAGGVICSPATEGWGRSEWSGEREKVLPKNFRDFRLELDLVPSPVGERSVSSKEQDGVAQFSLGWRGR